MGRKKNKRKVKRNWKQSGLQGISPGFDKERAWEAVKSGGILVLTAVGGGFLGAAIGRHSFFLGIPVAMAGKYFDNEYIVAAGLGMSVANGFQNTSKPLSGTGEVDGFDAKQMAQDAKDRVSKFFDNFKEKLYISPTKTSDPSGQVPATTAPSDGSTNGLAGDENVQYFINPMSNGLDLSALERVEQQVAALNRGTSGLEDIDREF